MTVSSTTTRIAYTGNGATTAFPVPFVFFGEDEVEVIERTIATGSETTKTLTTHYSVSGGNGSTGTVTAVSAPASTVEWHIRRRTARTQLVDYTPNDPFPSETHERALDRLTAIGQEIGETAERALVVPVTDPTDVTLQLPNSIDRASKFLAFNSDGSPTAVAGTGTAGAASTGTAGIVELATAGETITGTDTARAVTADGLAARLPLSSADGALFQQSSTDNVLEARGGDHGFKNRVINGEFNIDERGVTISGATIADAAYAMDRWKYIGEASATIAVANLTTMVNGVIPTCGVVKFTGTADKGGLIQFIESFATTGTKSFDSRTVTLSAYLRVSNARLGNLKMAIVQWAGTVNSLTSDPVSSWGADDTNPTLAANFSFLNTPANLNATTSWARFSVSATVGSSASNLAVMIWNDDKAYNANDEFYITGVQLEVSPVMTELESRPLSIEEVLCARYFQRIGGDSNASADPIATGLATSTTAFTVMRPLRTPMRSTPTLSASSAAHFSMMKSDGTMVACATLALVAGSYRKSVAISGTVASGLTAGNGTMLMSNSTSGRLSLLNDL